MPNRKPLAIAAGDWLADNRPLDVPFLLIRETPRISNLSSGELEREAHVACVALVNAAERYAEDLGAELVMEIPRLAPWGYWGCEHHNGMVFGVLYNVSNGCMQIGAVVTLKEKSVNAGGGE